MDTVIQVLIGIVIILIAIAGIYAATSAAIDSADEEVDSSSGFIQSCLSEGLSSEDCSLFSSNGFDNGGGG